MTSSDKKNWAGILAYMTKDKNLIHKRGELISLFGLEKLTKVDNQTFNLLVQGAYADILEDVEHQIEAKELRLDNRGSNDAVLKSCRRLMGVVAEYTVDRLDEKTGKTKSFTRLIHLLERADIPKDGKHTVFYKFPADMRALLKQSTYFATLQKQVMLAFDSKYSLKLYEMVAQRINLKHKNEEVFPIESFRALLGVEKGKLVNYFSLKAFAIDPAVKEVGQLVPEFSCSVEPLRGSRGRVDHVKLLWRKKTPEEVERVYREHSFSRCGRKPRRDGTVEKIVNVGHLPKEAKEARQIAKRGQLTEAEIEKLREEFGYLDFEGTLKNEFADFIQGSGQDPESVKNYYLRFRRFVELHKMGKD